MGTGDTDRLAPDEAEGGEPADTVKARVVTNPQPLGEALGGGPPLFDDQRERLSHRGGELSQDLPAVSEEAEHREATAVQLVGEVVGEIERRGAEEHESIPVLPCGEPSVRDPDRLVGERAAQHLDVLQGDDEATRLPEPLQRLQEVLTGGRSLEPRAESSTEAVDGKALLIHEVH